MLTKPPGSSRFQPGEGPSRGLLRDCTTSSINRFATLKMIQIQYPVWASPNNPTKNPGTGGQGWTGGATLKLSFFRILP